MGHYFQLYKRIRYFFNIIFSFFLSSNLFAQAPSIQWSKCYGGFDNDKAYDILQVDDGGFVVVGVAFSNGGDVVGLHDDFGSLEDIWLIKLDSLGNLQWQKCLGGSLIEAGYSIKKTIDNGFIILGYASSNDYDVSGVHGGNDYWLVKTNSAGDIQWQKCFGGSDFETPYSVIQTNDSGFAIIGTTQSTNGDVTGNHGNDIWIVKTTPLGALQWEKALGGWSSDVSGCIHQKQDSSYFFAGGTSSNDNDVSGNHGLQDYWVVTLDATGNIISQHCFGGTNSDGASSIIPDGYGGYFIAGGTLSNNVDVLFNHGGSDIWWIHIDSLNNIVSQQSFGGAYNENTASMKRTSDNNLILYGESEEPTDSIFLCNHGFMDGLIIKLDTSGNMIWNLCLGGSADDYLTSLVETRDGGFIACGYTNSNDGDITGYHQLPCNPQIACWSDFWVVKIAPLGLSNATVESFDNFLSWIDEFQNLHLKFYSGTTQQIQIEIYDVSGRTIYKNQKKVAPGSFQESLQLNSISAGIYFLTVGGERNRVTRKLINISKY